MLLPSSVQSSCRGSSITYHPKPVLGTEGWPWATIFGAAVWNIWKCRNQRIFNIDNCPSSNPTVAIKSLVADIMLAGGSGANNLISTKQVSMVGWKYPPELALVAVEC